MAGFLPYGRIIEISWLKTEAAFERCPTGIIFKGVAFGINNLLARFKAEACFINPAVGDPYSTDASTNGEIGDDIVAFARALRGFTQTSQHRIVMQRNCARELLFEHLFYRLTLPAR